MEIKIRNYTPAGVKKFQEGGEIDAPVDLEAPVEEAPAPQEQDPILAIAEMFMQGLQNQDCNMLALGAQAFLQVLGQALQQAQPVYRYGGKFSRWKY